MLQNSRDLQLVRTDLELARVAEKKLRARYLPRLSARAEAGINNETDQDVSDDYSDVTLGLNLSQDLLNMPYIYEIKAASWRTMAADARYKEVEQKLLHQFLLAWAAYWKALRQIEAGVENREILNRYRENARFRYDAGSLTITDVRLAETRYQEALSQTSRFLRDKVRTRETLKTIILSSVPRTVVLFGDGMGIDHLPEADAALNAHPKLAPLKAEAMVYKLRIKQHRSGHLPALKLVSSLDYQLEGQLASSYYPYTEARVGILLDIPLYSGGEISRETETARLQKSSLEVKIRQAREILLSDMETDRFNLTQSREEIAIARRQLVYAEQTLEGMNDEYEMGTRSSTDVFDVQADMIRAKLSLVEAKEQHARFLANYLLSLGVLDVSMLKHLSGDEP